MDSGLKQRLIGALVLVIAAVIFLPMLLTGQDETVQVQVDVPAAPTMDESDIVTTVPPTLPEPTPVPEIPQPVPETPEVMPQPVEEVAVAAPPVTPPSEPEPEPEPVAVAAGNWVVQQASFSSQENAEGFRQTLVGQGYSAYTRASQVDGKSIVRVYVGPLNTREAATQVRDELERRHQNKGLVVAYDETTRAL